MKKLMVVSSLAVLVLLVISMSLMYLNPQEATDKLDIYTGDENWSGGSDWGIRWVSDDCCFLNCTCGTLMMGLAFVIVSMYAARRR